MIRGKLPIAAPTASDSSRLEAMPDGQTWTPTGSPEDVDVLGYTNGTFVASTWRDRLWTSPDGVTWTMVQDNTSPEWAGVTSMAVAEPPHR